MDYEWRRLLDHNRDKMPIFEYSCNDCGTRFEKLVRRTEEAGGLACPSCGEMHLKTEYSTFAAHAGTGNGQTNGVEAGGACASMPNGGCCGGGCGMNYN